MSISKSTYLLLFLISEIFTSAAVAKNTCAYTNSDTIHPTQASECLYQPAENGVCCFVTTNDGKNWCLDLPMNKDTVDTSSYNDISEKKCPTRSKVVNNCGLVGILEPISLANCSSITIPESHCCYIEIDGATNEDGTQQKHVCRRVKKKPKNKEVSDSVKNEIKSLGADAKSVECFSMFYRVSYIFLITFAFILA